MDTKAIIDRAAKLIRQELPEKHWQIILFGSQANGDSHATSDVDIGILGPMPVPLEHMSAIHASMEGLPTLRSVDVVDLKSARNLLDNWKMLPKSVNRFTALILQLYCPFRNECST